MNEIKILKAGLLSTIQDGGRPEHQLIGMPVGGAMDLQALRWANYLVDNTPFEAAIEMTMTGCCLAFQCDTYAAVTGAQPEITLNDIPVQAWQTIKINAGDVLDIKSISSGIRSYLAIAGGFDVPLIMGCKSTYLYGKLGGYKGRPLKEGDVLPVHPTRSKYKIKTIKEDHIPCLPQEPVIRILPGPEKDRFSWAGISRFLTQKYSLSPQCDRMGYRLDGPVIEHLNNDADIISSPISFGTIQVPSHGSPIIMMADRQTTGGYTRIANVISADFSLLAQLKPGDKVSFQEVNLKDAVQLMKKQEKIWKKY